MEPAGIQDIKSRWGTILLVMANVVIFFILEIFGDTEDGSYMYEHGAMFVPAVMEDGEWWRLFTAGFLHFGFQHLLNNMVVLAVVGSILEKAMGHFRYLLLYLIALVGGNLFSMIMSLKNVEYAIVAGASGAVFGIDGGLLWVIIRQRGHYEKISTKEMAFMIFLSLFLGISKGGVDNWGHVGGLLAGFLSCIILYRRKT